MVTDKSFISKLVRKIRKVILWSVSIVLILFVLIFLLLLIPGVQNLITSKAEVYLEKKLHTKVEIGMFRLALPKAVMLKDVYVEDLSGDTLLFSHMIKVDVQLTALIRKKVQINELLLQRVTGHIYRNDTLEGYNFDFIIHAFSSPPDTMQKVEPDTNSSGWDIQANQIMLEEIQLSYRDDVNDLNTGLDLGNLQLKLNEMDLNKISFDVEYLSLSQINVFYSTPKAGQMYDLVLGESQLLRQKINITDQWLNLGVISFSNTIGTIRQEMRAGTDKAGANVTQGDEFANSQAQTKSEAFQILPGWKIQIGEITLAESSFRMDNMNFPESEDMMDFNHLFFRDIRTKIRDIRLEGTNAGLVFSDLALVEKCGIQIKNFESKISVDSTKTVISDLDLLTSNSKVQFDLDAEYPSVASFIHDISKLSFDLDLKNSTIDWTDLNYFVPLDIPLPGNSREYGPIDLSLAIAGSLDAFNISRCSIKILENTEFSLKGSAKNVLDIENLYADLHLDSLFTTSTDLDNLLGKNLHLGFILPPEITLKSDIKGSIKDLSVDLSLKTTFGNAILLGKMADDSTNADKFSADIRLADLDVGQFVSDSTIGQFFTEIKVSGGGLIDGSLVADYDILVNESMFNGYNYSGIAIQGHYSENSAIAHISTEDPNLDLLGDLAIVLSSDQTDFSANMDLKNVNLLPLNLYAEDLRIKAKMDARVSIMDSSRVSADVSFKNLDIILNDIQYLADSIVAQVGMFKDTTIVKLNSDFIDIYLNSNFNLSGFQELFRERSHQYLLKEKDTLDLAEDHFLEFDVKVKNTDILTEIFVPELDALEVHKFSGYWNEGKDLLFVSADIPRVSYSGVEIDSVLMEISADPYELDYSLDVRKITYDTIFFNRINLAGTLKDGILDNSFTITDKSNILQYSIPIKGEIKKNEYLFFLLSDDLVLNYGSWKSRNSEFIKIDSTGVLSGSTSISKDQQGVDFKTENGFSSVSFKDFKVSTFASIINIYDSVNIVNGIVNGIVELNNTTSDGSIFADIGIEGLYILGQPLGVLDVRLENPSPEKFLVNLLSEYKTNLLKIKGSYLNTDLTAIDLNIDLNFSNLQSFEPFLSNWVSDLGGSITGKANLKGSLNDLDYNGELNFDQTRVKVNSINMVFTLPQENLSVKKDKMSFNQFTLLDQQNNKFTVDGSILLNSEKNIGFDLNIHSDQFTFINSTKEDNALLYGNLTMTTDFKIHGDASSPVIKADITILNATDITYELPGSSIEMVTGEGIVNFSDRKSAGDSLTLLTQTDYLTDTILSIIPGVEISSILTLQPDAIFTVVLDPSSGDYVTISGLANLNFSIDKSQTVSVSGVFEVIEGFYQVSFYHLVKKKFEITKGSAVTWSNELMDGLLNITAEYIIRTSSYGLVSNMTGQMSEVEMAVYNQRIPFHVKLMITGTMDKPVIKFGLDVPDKYKGELPTLATAINLLNQEDYESELNKQVFALLVTGTFIPQGGTDGGSSSFATTAARNSLNGILAEQLNNLSGQYIKGVDLNFGLTSYDNYSGGSSDMRTELDVTVQKKLFKERVTVEAAGTFDLSGSNDKSSNAQTYTTYGEFNLYYDLNEYKDLKLKVFSERAYDLFDGEIMASGFGIIVQKDFDDMAELKKDRAMRKEKRKEKKSEK